MIITVRDTAERAAGHAEERRRQILEAAATVFARHGYHQARTREIAREAGIAEGTIYNYFPSKRELLLAIVDQVATESIPMMCQEPDCGDLHAMLKCLLEDRLGMLERNSQIIKAVVPEMINDAELRRGYLGEVALHLVKALMPLQERVLTLAWPRQFNPRVVLPALAGALVVAFVFNEMADFPMGRAASQKELAEELARLFLGGLYQRVGPQACVPIDSENATSRPCHRFAPSARKAEAIVRQTSSDTDEGTSSR